MNEDVKGCLTVIAVIVVFILAGNLLTSIIEKAWDIIVWLIRAAVFISLIVFIIGVIRGMKKRRGRE